MYVCIVYELNITHVILHVYTYLMHVCRVLYMYVMTTKATMSSDMREREREGGREGGREVERAERSTYRTANEAKMFAVLTQAIRVVIEN